MTIKRIKTQMLGEIAAFDLVCPIRMTSSHLYPALAATLTYQSGTAEDQALRAATSRVSGNVTDPAWRPLPPVPEGQLGKGRLVFTSESKDQRELFRDSDSQSISRAQGLTPFLGEGTQKTTLSAASQLTPCTSDILLGNYQIHISTQFVNITNVGITDPSPCATTCAYGAPARVLGSTGRTPNNPRYTSEEYDPNAAIYYLRARYYSETLGRSHTGDAVLGPIFDPPSLHRDVYEKNNPVSCLDPSGNFALAEEMVVVAIQRSILCETTLIQSKMSPYKTWWTKEQDFDSADGDLEFEVMPLAYDKLFRIVRIVS